MVVAVVALPLAALSILVTERAPTTAAPHHAALLRPTPVPGDDTQAVRPGGDGAEAMRAAGVRALAVVVVLLGAGWAFGAAPAGAVVHTPAAIRRPGRGAAAAGRDPPVLLPA